MAKVYNMTGGGGGGIKLSSIAITKQPDKTNYLPGETFNPAGMVVEATYSNGAKMEATGYKFEPDGALTEGLTEITVKYSEAGTTKTALVSITVERATIEIPVQSGSLTYTGEEQSPVWEGYDPAKMTIDGETAATDAGTYTATFTPTMAYKWTDGGTDAREVSWSIAKASPNLTISPESLTLNTSTKTAIITISHDGDGVLTIESDNTAVCTVTLEGKNATVTSVDNKSGTANIVVSLAEGTNWTAAEKACAVKAQFTFVYGVKIQKNNSNPETAVTYIDDAVGMTPGKDSPLFSKIRPCFLKNGIVQYYLKPSNLFQKEDGNASEIYIREAGETMLEIPRLGYKFESDNEYHYIRITDAPNAEGYCYRAHSLDAEGDCDYIYIGCFLAEKFSQDGKEVLSSTINRTPTASTTLFDFRAYAENKGTGYQLLSFYPLTLLQILYLIKYKNRNGQEAIGMGYVNADAARSTGGTASKGPDYGESTGTEQMCFLNIEDFWGNLRQLIDGVYCDSSYNIKTTYKDFNDEGSGYPYSKYIGRDSNISGFMSDIQGTNEGGFIISSTGGSGTTYYADVNGIGAGYVLIFGGLYDTNPPEAAGAFFTQYTSPTDTAISTGARLIYKHKEVT